MEVLNMLKSNHSADFARGGGAKYYLKPLFHGHYGKFYVSEQRYRHIFEYFERINNTGIVSRAQYKCNPASCLTTFSKTFDFVKNVRFPAGSYYRYLIPHNNITFASHTAKLHLKGDLVHAFTLAEVLITLGIIGVVAAITMPGLIANYEKQVTITKLKKDQSVLAQGIRMAELDNGDICSWFGSSPISVRGNIFMDNYILPYFKTIKSSSKNGYGTDMRIYGYEKEQNVFLQLNGSTVDSRYEMESFISPDNMYFGFNMIDNKGFNTGAANASPFRHAWIPVLVDINGSARPNRVGRDVFFFEILSENCAPAKVVGLTSSKSMSSSDGYKLKVHYKVAMETCKKGKSGEGCLVKILNDGWKIKDDYPW